jgi:hypothetical protein
MSLFKTCPLCTETWADRDRFLEDPQLELIGYQADFEDVALGLFLFNHRRCGTTLAIRSGLFADLYHGPRHCTRRAGSESCPGLCLRSCELAPCPADCECAWVREVLQVIRNWPSTWQQRTAAGSGG